MKIRTIVMLWAIIVATAAASAQPRWGIEAGANVSHAFSTTKTKVGFNVGAIGAYSFTPHWALEAALKLSSQPCGNLAISGLSTQSDKDYTPVYLTLPVRAAYSAHISRSVRLSVGAGPMIGVGLFGRGSWNYEVNSFPNIKMESRSHQIFNPHTVECFSSSRFEYGANVRVGLEFMRHYTLSVDYSLLHIPGKYTAVDNMGIVGINLGYIF